MFKMSWHPIIALKRRDQEMITWLACLIWNTTAAIKQRVYRATSAWQQKTRIHFAYWSATVVSISCQFGIERICHIWQAVTQASFSLSVRLHSFFFKWFVVSVRSDQKLLRTCKSWAMTFNRFHFFQSSGTFLWFVLVVMVLKYLWKDQLSHATHSLLNQFWNNKQTLHKFPQRNLELLKIKIASISRQKS